MTGRRNAAVLYVGGCLVVFEGPARLRWDRLGHTRWRVAGRWPDETEARGVADRLSAGQPVLVILDRPQAVPMLREEWPEGDAPGALDDVTDVEVPLLDWLPEATRRRGQRFLTLSSAVLAEEPRLLLPPLLLDAPDPDEPHIRFARRTTPAPFWPDNLRQVVETVFSPNMDAEPDPTRPTSATRPTLLATGGTV